MATRWRARRPNVVRFQRRQRARPRTCSLVSQHTDGSNLSLLMATGGMVANDRRTGEVVAGGAMRASWLAYGCRLSALGSTPLQR